MIRGVFLLTQNKYSFVLRDILKNANLDGLVWDIGYVEIISTEDSRRGRFSEKYMTNETFMKKAQKPPKYYPIFGDFKAFPNKDSIKSIQTYSDFLNSDCQLIILIADVEFISIYAKNKDLIEQIKKNAEEIGCEEIEYITDENDTRYRMSI